MPAISSRRKMDGETVVIGGGSDGVGRALAELMVRRGANVVVLARNNKNLETLKRELSPLLTREDQLIETISMDLSDPTQVGDFVDSLQEIPSHVFCVAGGCAEEVGLFAEITPEQISSCFQKNYFTSAYLAQAIIRFWITNPQKSPPKHLIFTNSTAAFVALPGYAAYTPTKTALRALVDTLRQEVLLYESIVDIKIHCSFPGTILTAALLREQELKPEICKRLEGTDDLENAMTPKQVAEAIVKGVDEGRYFIPMDLQTRLLLNNMRGPSPAETWGWDWLLGFIASLVWPFFRWDMDRTTRKIGVAMRR